MSLLVLGGTQFLGYTVATQVLQRGWLVTCLHAGHHAPPPGAGSIVADRRDNSALDALGQHTWDCVIDTWSGSPEAVVNAVDRLADRTSCYQYVSSRSVYAWPAPAGADESAPLVALPESPVALDYAQAKLRAEDAVRSVFGGRCLIARAGMLLGPRERPCRLTWWLARISRGGVIPVPGPPELDIQYADARDVSAWMLDCAADSVTGIFNVVGPPGGATMASLMAKCLATTGSDAKLVWVDPAIVAREGIEAWTQVPIWLPPGPEHASVHRGDTTALAATGFRQRDLAETVEDTWLWMQGPDGIQTWADQELGLSTEVERRLLASRA